MTIELLDGMPEGTIGFRARGRVTKQEYDDVLLPPIRAAAEAGDVRMVFALGPGFEKLEVGALAEDTRAAITLGFGHWRAWKRLALVTDVEWAANAWRMFAWMTPAQVKVYELDGLDEAKSWIAG